VRTWRGDERRAQKACVFQDERAAVELASVRNCNYFHAAIVLFFDDTRVLARLIPLQRSVASDGPRNR